MTLPNASDVLLAVRSGTCRAILGQIVANTHRCRAAALTGRVNFCVNFLRSRRNVIEVSQYSCCDGRAPKLAPSSGSWHC